MPYAHLEDVDLWFEDLGRRHERPLMLLHGFTVTGRVNWAPYLDAFERDYRVIVPDLRGHGRSNNPGGPAAMNHRQFARDIAGLCRYLEIGRAAFCGYSAGAILQLSLAVDEPQLVAASVLISGSTCLPEATRTVMRRKSADQLAYEWFGLSPNRRPGDRPVSAAWHTALGPDHWHQVLVDFLTLFDHRPDDDFPSSADISGIEAPTLIIHGESDAYFGPGIAEELSLRLADCELHIMAGTPHEILDADPALVRSLCTAFLVRRYTETADLPTRAAVSPG